MKGSIAGFLKASGQWVVVLAIILLFVIALARIFFPYLDHYKEYFEKRTSAALHQPVTIEKIDASWRGLWPVINFENIIVYDTNRQDKILQAQRLQIIPNIFASLWQQQIITSRLALIGTTLSIKQLGNNAWEINGITTQFGQQNKTDSMHNVLTWFQQQGEISISKANIAWYGVDGLQFQADDAQLKLTAEKEQRTIYLAANNLQIKLEKLFSSPLQFDYIAAAFAYPTIQPEPEIFLKEFSLANQDIQVAGRMKIHKQAQKNSPVFIQLMANISGDNIANIHQYIPHGVLKKGLTDWLKNALVKSDAFTGQILVQGAADQIPYVQQNGRFETLLHIQNLNLNYQPGWPAITDMTANLFFDNQRLEIAVQQAKIRHITTGEIHAEIPDVKHGILNIHWTSGESYQNLKDFIVNSPLNRLLGKTLGYLDYQGSSKLLLNLSIPLHKHNQKEIKANGSFNLSGGTLAVPKYKINFANITGLLAFTENTINAKKIKGSWLGQPTVINVITHRSDPAAAEIDVSAAGTLDFAKLGKNFNARWLADTITGKSPYDALLRFYTGKQQPHNILAINSNLSGAAINLPEPLKKSAAEVMPAKIQLATLENSHVLTVNVDNKLNGSIDMRENLYGQWQLFSANLQLGNANPTIVKTPGIFITAKIPQLNIVEIVQHFPTTAASGNFTEKWLAFVDFLGPNAKKIHLAFDQLNVYDMMIHQARIDINQIQQAWKIKIASQEITGNISIPNNLAQKPIQGVFQHFYFNSAIGQSSGSSFTQKLNTKNNSVNPGSIPSLYLLFENFYYDNHPLGEICLITTRQKNAMKIQEFTVDFPHFSLFSTGQWNFNGGKQHTFFTGNIKTTSLGEFLKNWRITESVRGAKGAAAFSLEWDGPAYNPDVNELSGQVQLAFEKGEILKVVNKPSDSGIGMILNLLTFEILKQIFTPSARENSKKGDLDFSVLRADLAIKNGNAYTDNIFLDGEMAKVKSNGRIGLAAKDYDLMVQVTPYVASAIVPGASLPVVGSIIRGSLKIVNKTIGGMLNRFFIMMYHVTGPWASPSFTRVAN